MHRSALIIVCCLLGQTVSQYTFYVLLEQFSAGSGFLSNGQRCNMFWWTPNVQCDLDIQLCVEPLSGKPDTNMGNCAQPGTGGAYVQLNVTRNKNSIIFERDWYGSWKNPVPILVPSGSFEGFQVKVNVNHHGDDNNVYLIDQYVYTFSNGQPAGSYAYSHPRPSAPEPTLATTGTDTCSTVFIDLGQVTTNQNSINFATNMWYGAWLNPSPFRFVDNAFEGIQVKLIAQHTGVNDYPLIDQFVWQIRNNSQTGVTSISHTRPNAPDPTVFQLAWTVGPNVSAPATTTPSGPPITSTTAAPLPHDCFDVSNGTITSGVYSILLPNGNIVEVYCDVAQGGWTVIQNRADETPFNVSYETYQTYFGSAGLATSYWLGLDNIHSLVNSKTYSLKIELCCGSSAKSELYNSFTIGDSGTKYLLAVSAGIGAAGDGFNESTAAFVDNGKPFSTPQNYSGPLPQNYCNGQASGYGGWWFGSCVNNLNGFLYINGSSSYTPPGSQCLLTSNPNGKGVVWAGTTTTWTKARMMVLPSSQRSLPFDLEQEQQKTADFCNA